MVTLNPLACRSLANDAAMIPLPREEATPPVTKTYFVFIPDLVNVPLHGTYVIC